MEKAPEKYDPGLLYPVISAVSTPDPKAAGGRGEILSAQARKAAVLSAQKQGRTLSAFPKNSWGAPKKIDGLYWSLSHKPDYVGGVAAPAPVGLDIEKIKPRAPGIFRKTASQVEWNLAMQRDWRIFFRYWTAKEAVLKALGVGIGGLSRCRVTAVVDAARLCLRYDGENWWVFQAFFDGHMAAVASRPPPVGVVWRIIGPDGSFRRIP